MKSLIKNKNIAPKVQKNELYKEYESRYGVKATDFVRSFFNKTSPVTHKYLDREPHTGHAFVSNGKVLFIGASSTPYVYFKDPVEKNSFSIPNIAWSHPNAIWSIKKITPFLMTQLDSPTLSITFGQEAFNKASQHAFPKFNGPDSLLKLKTRVLWTMCFYDMMFNEKCPTPNYVGIYRDSSFWKELKDKPKTFEVVNLSSSHADLFPNHKTLFGTGPTELEQIEEEFRKCISWVNTHSSDLLWKSWVASEISDFNFFAKALSLVDEKSGGLEKFNKLQVKICNKIDEKYKLGLNTTINSYKNWVSESIGTSAGFSKEVQPFVNKILTVVPLFGDSYFTAYWEAAQETCHIHNNEVKGAFESLINKILELEKESAFIDKSTATGASDEKKQEALKAFENKVDEHYSGFLNFLNYSDNEFELTVLNKASAERPKEAVKALKKTEEVKGEEEDVGKDDDFEF